MKNEEEPHTPKRRILCIDGGGILGTFPAAFLAGLEQHLPHPIGSYFDLIAGTSTGGIIAIGLAMGLRASDLLDLYEKRGPEIFGQGRGPVADFLCDKLRLGRWLVMNKHDAGPLRAVLEDVLGGKRIGDARTRLLIPAWNPVARSVYIYKTAHHPRLKNDYKALAVDAALATAAAPTYFRQHVTQHAVGLTDGGTWANNPMALAVVEAITLLRWPRNSLHVLSLGCLEETYTINKWAGIGTLGSKVIKLCMDGQSHGAMGIAKLLTGHEHERTAIHRINHTVPSNTYRMDDTRVIQDLKGLGYSFARDRQPVLDPVFFGSPAEAFSPIYTLDGEPVVTLRERLSA
ncbi:CBASS cGAMP-activated phospholipase [Methylocaldum sp. SAD2]|jgi:patatin-like phospholipase/acyl hydrolase|uniref:CBASS cGAMP-activated phospholipase n=1 Tax=Methylocaldum sp. GT1BB TaxID=3438963 RepID=UPI000A323304